LAVAVAAAWPPPDLYDLRHAAFSVARAVRGALGGGVPAEDGARGFFPPGCRWRDARNEVSPATNLSPRAQCSPRSQLTRCLHAASLQTEPVFWDVREYEYWDEAAGAWGAAQPAACLLDPPPVPAGWVGANASATTQRCAPEYCIYHNVWYNQGRYYHLHDGAATVVRQRAACGN
jgi:hypothetical protein